VTEIAAKSDWRSGDASTITVSKWMREGNEYVYSSKKETAMTEEDEVRKMEDPKLLLRDTKEEREH
jgi:hypothetical protein